MKIIDLYYWIERYRTRVNHILLPAIILIGAGVYLLVHQTGDTPGVLAHTMYLPIALAAIAFGAEAGVLAALIAGLLLGPLLPIDTQAAERQDSMAWLYRVGFFALVGFLMGITRDIAVIYLKKTTWHANHDSMTGLPNTLSLERLIQELLDAGEKGSKTPYLIIARLGNQAQLEAGFGVQCVNGIIVQLAEAIRRELSDSADVYRVGTEGLGFVQWAEDENALKDPVNKLGHVFTKPLGFGQVQLHADVYLGIVALAGAVK